MHRLGKVGYQDFADRHSYASETVRFITHERIVADQVACYEEALSEEAPSTEKRISKFQDYP